MIDTKKQISDILTLSPVIAAVRREQQLLSLCKTENSPEIVFVLHAEVSDVARLSDVAKSTGKTVFLHADLIEGLNPDDAAMRFLKSATAADGIISTRSGVIRAAKDAGFLTVQRFFVVDSQAEDTILRTVGRFSPDCIELMPGLIAPVIARIVPRLQIPVIAGGLIETKEQIIGLLSAGACGVSTSCESLWEI